MKISQHQKNKYYIPTISTTFLTQSTHPLVDQMKASEIRQQTF